MSLDKPNFLRHIYALFRCTETGGIGCSRIRLLASVGYTHPTPSGDVELDESSFLAHSCNDNEANIIGKNVNVI